MPHHTTEDLANWQLAQVGKTLPTTSAINEAMKITETVAGFNRLIGYKTNSTDLHQAKINAIDGASFSGVPTYPTANLTEAEQNLKFDKYGKPIPVDGEVGDDTADSGGSKSSNQIYIDKGFHEEKPGPKPKLTDFPVQPGDEIAWRWLGRPYNHEVYQAALKEWQEKKNTYRTLTKTQVVYDGESPTRSKTITLTFNPETDSYDEPPKEDGLLNLKTTEERKLQKEFLIQKSRDARIERAALQPDSKVVNVHRTNDGRYIQGPITVYKHVDEDGYVQYKMKPSGPKSNLQSFWNIPGSPVLSPALQDYAMELYGTNLQTA